MKLYKLSANQQFFKFLLYFSVLFLTLLILLGSLNYAYSIKAIDDKNERYYKSLLGNVKHAIENRLKYLNELSVFLLNDKRFKRLQGDSDWENNRIDAFEIVNELKVIQFTNPQIEDISLYIAKKQSLLRIYGTEEPVEYLQRTYGKTFRAFDDILANAPVWSNFYYLQPADLEINNQRKNAMTFIKTNAGSGSAVSAGILFMINTRWLDGILPAQKPDNHDYAFIRDSSGTIITSGGSLAAIDSDDYATFSERIDGLPWEVVILVKKNAVLFVKDYTQSFYVIVGGLLLAGLLLSLLLSVGNYKPVRKIVNLIDGGGEKGDWTVKDEFMRIKKYIREKGEATALLEAELQQYAALSRETRLYRLVSDMPLEEGELRQLAAEAFAIGTKPAAIFLVVHMLIGKSSGLGGQSDDAEANAVQQLSDAVGRYTDSHAIVFHELSGGTGQRIYLLGFGSDSASVSLLLFLQSYKAELEAEYGISVYMGAGSLVHQLADMADASAQAADSLSYAMIRGDRAIVVHGQEKTGDDVFDYSPETEAKLLNAFADKDRPAVELIVTDIVRNNLQARSLTPSAARILYIELCATMMKGLKAANPQFAGFDLEALGKNYSLRDLPALALQSLALAEQEAAGEPEADSLHNRVIRLVDESYGQPKLTLQYIAEQLNTTPYTISKHLQIDLQAYINQKRLARAVDLLLESEYPIHEIAERCGFSDANVFIRTFKRYETMTPGQFRKKYTRKI